MALKEKVELLELTEEEKAKAREKFIVTFSLLTHNELEERLDFLKSKGIHIGNAREIKILNLSKEELEKKFDILDEIGESAIYKNDPNKLCLNVIDIYKRIKYCIQIGKNYKNNNEYEPFLFNESLWKEELNKTDNPMLEDNNEEVVTLPPSAFINEEKKDSNENDIDLTKFIDQKDDVLSFADISNENEKEEEMKKAEEEIDQKIVDFSEVKKELEGQLKELDELKNFEYADGISFTDLEPDSFETGRGM